jgi:hypothetical protein
MTPRLAGAFSFGLPANRAAQFFILHFAFDILHFGFRAPSEKPKCRMSNEE